MTTFTFLGSLTVIVALGTITTGLVVLLRDRSSHVNRSLFASACLFGLWMLANYYSNDITQPYNTQLLINRLIFVTSTGATGLLSIFFIYLDDSKKRKKLKKLLYLSTISVAVLCFTPYVVSDIKPMLPVTEVAFGSLASLYFMAVGIFLATSIFVFYKSLKRTRGLKKSQLQVIGWASISSIFLGFITNAILPFFFGEFNMSAVGPLFFSIMVFGFAYAIVVQRLFDVRLVIARSVAYILVALIGGFIYFYVAQEISHLLEENMTQNSRSLFNSSIILLVAVGFHPAVGFFNKITIKIFYKNNYEERQVINKLSTILISQTDLRKLSSLILDMLDSFLHPQALAVYANVNGRFLEIATKNPALFAQPSGRIAPFLKRPQEAVVLLENEKSASAKALHKKHAVDVVVSLTCHNSLEGVILLGFKQSGEVYTTRDTELLTVIGKNIGLALSNAKKYEEIREFTDTLEKRIHDATSRLRYSNIELEKLNNLKNDFISATSHQLKPQLTSARGFAEMISTSKSLEAADKKYLNFVLKSLDRMSGIVSGILESSTGDEQILQLAPSRFSLSNLVTGEVKVLKHRIKEKQLYLDLQVAPRIYITADKQKCLEAIYNLIDNAIRYTPILGHIKIDLYEDRGQAVFKVADSGIGMTKNEQKNLFKKFYRAEKAKKIQPSGTGIGLYVAKQFIEAHDGRIVAESSPGAGTTFTVLIPF